MLSPSDVKTDTQMTRGPWGLAALLFFACAVLLAWPWLSSTVTIPWDAKAHNYAQLQFLAQSLHAGDSPFWTPNVFGGSPQIADPQSFIFSPPFFLLALMDADPSFQAADGVVFAMLGLAGLSVLALFRDRKWGAEGGLVAAISVAFGGSAAWRLQHIGEVLSLCWFVITLWLLLRAMDRRSFLWGFCSGLTAGCMLAGRDQIAFLSMLVLTVVALGWILQAPKLWAGLCASLCPLSAGTLGGLLTASVPIAFSVALASQSNRAEIVYTEAARGGLHPAAFLTTIVANLFGTDGPNDAFWGPPVQSVWGPNTFILARNMGDLYFGILPVAVLLGVGLVCGRLFRAEVRSLFVSLILLIGYGLGGYAPFFRWMFALPGVDLFRRPADATFPLCAVAAILAGYCVHCWLREPQQRKVFLSSVVGVLVVGVAICAGTATWAGRISQATPPLLTASFFALTASGLLVSLAWLRNRAPALALVILVVLPTWDLAISNRPNESTGLPPQTYDVLRPTTTNSTVLALKTLFAREIRPDHRDRVELVGLGFEWPNMTLVHGMDHDFGYNPIRLKWFEDVTQAQDQLAVPEQRVFPPLFSSYQSPLAALLGLRYVASSVPLENLDPKGGANLQYLGRTDDAYLYENKTALPRVLMVTQARQVNFAEMISQGQWPGVDYSKTVLLEHPGPRAAQEPAVAGSFRLVHYGNTEIRVEAVAPEGGGWLVLNDVWHPWWAAKVDGQRVPLERANLMFRAVRVEEGVHRVEFVFEPFTGLWADLRNLVTGSPAYH